MKKIIENPFCYGIDSKQLVLNINGDVHNNQWYLYFGKIEKVILDSQCNRILVNFNNCNYVCPNLIIALKLIVELTGKLTLNVDFNNCSLNFVKYCIKEYDLKFDIERDQNYYSENYITILPLVTYNLNENININDLVEKIILEFNNLDLIFKNQYEEDSFKIKIQNILFELIDNSNKYAYESSAIQKPIGIYVRYVKANDSTRKVWNLGNDINDKTMSDDVLVSSKIELYYQDAGKGLINGYKEKYELKTNSKRPLKEIFKKTYFYNAKELNELKVYREDNTDIRGLQYVGKILEKSRNYLMVFENYEWVGSYLVNPEKNLHSAFSLKDYEITDNLNGLSYVFSFDLPSVSIESITNTSKLDENVFYSLCASKNTEINVVDYRGFLEKGSYTGEINDKHLNNKLIINDDLSTLFVFLGPISSKHSIIWKISKAVSIRKNVKNIILCDIADLELDMVAYSINNTKASVIGNIKNIFIVSETLMLKKFEVKNNIFVLNKFYSFSDFNKETDYVYKIRYYETFNLIKLQEQNAFANYMITKGQIKWNDEIILDGYINFDILTSSHHIFNFLKTNLKRTISMFGFPKLIPLDNMVSRLADEINAELLLENKKSVLYLGSVYVSGTTSRFNSLDSQDSIHFFNRNSNVNICSIFLSPENLLKSNGLTQSFARIGKSYKIIEEENLNKSINSRSYLDKKDTYQLFDKNSYNSIICNHCNFYGKHYILDIDLIKIYQDKTSKLQEFMLKMIKTSLGHYINDNTSDTFFKEMKDCCGIVYLSHHYTDSIISNILEYCMPYEKYIIGLNHINLFRHEQRLEFSGIYEKYITNLIDEYRRSHEDAQIKFIIFDTLISSGRTRKEIKVYLQSLGVDRVIFVSLIDSQEQRYDKSSNNASFMTAPFPKLGSNSSCPICDVIDSQKAFSQNIIAPELVVRLNEICDIWKCNNLIVARSIIENKNIIPITSGEINLPSSQYKTAEDIVFNKVFSLYLFISEQIRQINDFWIFDNFLNNKFSTLDVDSAVLILSLFALEFYEQSYVKLKIKVLKLMIEKLGKVSDKTISSLCYIFLLKYKDDTINALKQMQINKLSLSNDLHLLLLYCFYYPMIAENVAFIKDSDARLAISLESEIKGGNAKIDVYKQLHCQLVNINGDTHDSPLLRFINLKDEKCFKETGISSLELLKKSLESNTIYFDVTFDPSFPLQRYEKLISEINEIISNCENGISENIYSKVNSIFNESLQLHSHLISPLGISETHSNTNNIIYKISNIVDEYNQNNEGKEVYFDEGYELPTPKYSSKELFYVFNHMLVKEIRYGLDNIRKHCFSDDECKVKKINVGGTEYAAILTLEIKEECINIDIINNVERTIDEPNFKLRYEKEELKSLGITISRIDCEKTRYANIFEKNCFILRITIPNINFYSNKGDSYE